MATLFVLYDQDCSLCRRACSWLAEQPQWVLLQFIPAGSSKARELFPDLDHPSTLSQVTVVGNDGSLYVGAKAWVMCLWALKEHREKAIRFSSPALMPSAERFVNMVARNRHRWS